MERALLARRGRDGAGVSDGAEGFQVHRTFFTDAMNGDGRRERPFGKQRAICVVNGVTYCFINGVTYARLPS